jgi:putative aldouronate transport system permease protein
MSDLVQANPDTIKAATIMVVTLPIIILYPFLQKYFVKGIVVGSLKG